MTGYTALRLPAESVFAVLLLGLFPCHGSAGQAHPSQSESPAALLLEARNAALSIQETAERTDALTVIVGKQVQLDPSGARETLKMFPKLPNKLTYLADLAAAFAKAGNIPETDDCMPKSSSKTNPRGSANWLPRMHLDNWLWLM